MFAFGWNVHWSQRKHKTVAVWAREQCCTAGGELDPAEAIRMDGRRSQTVPAAWNSGPGAGRARTAHCVLQTPRRDARTVSRTGTRRPAAVEQEGGCSVETTTGACPHCRSGTVISNGAASCHCAKDIFRTFYFIYLQSSIHPFPIPTSWVQGHRGLLELLPAALGRRPGDTKDKLYFFFSIQFTQ